MSETKKATKEARLSASLRLRATLCLLISLVSTFQPRTDRAIHCRPERPPIAMPAAPTSAAASFVCLVDPVQ